MTGVAVTGATGMDIESRLAGRDWPAFTDQIDSHGCAVMDGLLTAD